MQKSADNGRRRRRKGEHHDDLGHRLPSLVSIVNVADHGPRDDDTAACRDTLCEAQDQHLAQAVRHRAAQRCGHVQHHSRDSYRAPAECVR